MALASDKNRATIFLVYRIRLFSTLFLLVFICVSLSPVFVTVIVLETIVSILESCLPVVVVVPSFPPPARRRGYNYTYFTHVFQHMQDINLFISREYMF